MYHTASWCWLLLREICASVQIGGVSRTESGIYEVVTTTSGCDSISLIDLLVLEKPYDIMVSEMELSCDILTSELTLANLPSTVSVNWSTIDGFLLSAAGYIHYC